MLARALDTAPVALMYPPPYSAEVELLPGDMSRDGLRLSGSRVAGMRRARGFYRRMATLTSRTCAHCVPPSTSPPTAAARRARTVTVRGRALRSCHTMAVPRCQSGRLVCEFASAEENCSQATTTMNPKRAP